MGWFARWRRRRAARRKPVDDRAWAAVVRRLRFLRTLPAADQERLRDRVAAFLDEKSIHGAGGLELTEPMRLLIAAQACLLVLDLDLDWYDDWVEVIVYPDEFIVEHDYTDEDGVVHRVREPRSGEAWERGPVVLSWLDAEAAGGGDGYNVVIHEFAHKLDLRNGEADGYPPLHAGMSRAAWTEAFSAAYADFGHRIDHREDTLIDDYAAEDPGEFFAVLSEVFFERPEALHHDYPAVYRQLVLFYRQDPLSRLPNAAPPSPPPPQAST
jgi:Mlc titration factor MtfA (ptsG expression regulator)